MYLAVLGPLELRGGGWFSHAALLKTQPTRGLTHGSAEPEYIVVMGRSRERPALIPGPGISWPCQADPQHCASTYTERAGAAGNPQSHSSLPRPQPEKASDLHPRAAWPADRTGHGTKHLRETHLPDHQYGHFVCCDHQIRGISVSRPRGYARPSQELGPGPLPRSPLPLR